MTLEAIWGDTDVAGVMDARLIDELRAIAPTKTDEPLGRHTTFGIGGPADAFVTVRNATELARAVLMAREFEAPVFLLGAGSNVLIGDAGSTTIPLALARIAVRATAAVDSWNWTERQLSRNTASSTRKREKWLCSPR